MFFTLYSRVDGFSGDLDVLISTFSEKTCKHFLLAKFKMIWTPADPVLKCVFLNFLLTVLSLTVRINLPLKLYPVMALSNQPATSLPTRMLKSTTTQFSAYKPRSGTVLLWIWLTRFFFIPGDVYSLRIIFILQELYKIP